MGATVDIEKDPTIDQSSDENSINNNNDFKILYITFAIIIGLIILWIIVDIFYRNNNYNILGEILSIDSQTTPLVDIVLT